MNSQTIRDVLQAVEHYATAPAGDDTMSADQALKSIQTLILTEVIGKDETSKARPDKLKQSPPYQRNQVRAKQRQALSELMGGNN